jgi:hypothetical protein
MRDATVQYWHVVRDRQPRAHRRINPPAELPPDSGVSGFHRMVESGDVPDVPRLIGGHSW